MTQSLASHVAAQLRAEMARQEMPAVRLAGVLGVSDNWVIRRMRGRNPINMDDLERIATVLNVPISYFLPSTERVA